jgi:hypothetical protein
MNHGNLWLVWVALVAAEFIVRGVGSRAILYLARCAVTLVTKLIPLNGAVGPTS